MTDFPSKKSRARRLSTSGILSLIVALVLIRGLIYAIVVPPWQAPDEPAQFERTRAALTPQDWASTSANPPGWYAQLSQSLFEFNFWDFLDVPRATYSPEAPLNRYITLYQEAYDGLYGSRLAYAVMAWPLFLLQPQEIALQLYLVRFNMILMNVGIILFAYLLSRTIFPKDTFLALGVPMFILFNPQHTHLLSTVNNGNLAELLAAATLYFMVAAIIKGFSWLRVIAILLFAILAMWAKATAYFLPMALGSIGLFYLWRYRRHWRWLMPTGLLLAGLIYVFLPKRLLQLVFKTWTSVRNGTFYLDPIVPTDLFRSFWGMPGWTILPLDRFWYWTLAGCVGLAFIGLIALVVTKWPLLFAPERHPQLQALVVLAIAALVAIGILLGWNALTQSIVYRQARSLYPVMIPMALFLMLGWRQLIPQNWRKVGLLGIALLLFLFDTLVLVDYIIPLFHSRY